MPSSHALLSLSVFALALKIAQMTDPSTATVRTGATMAATSCGFVSFSGPKCSPVLLLDGAAGGVADVAFPRVKAGPAGNGDVSLYDDASGMMSTYIDVGVVSFHHAGFRSTLNCPESESRTSHSCTSFPSPYRSTCSDVEFLKHVGSHRMSNGLDGFATVWDVGEI